MRAVFIALAIMLGVSSAYAEEIKEIVVEENTKTDDETVALIARIEVGDDWNLDMIETIKMRLLGSGLFKEATVFSEAHKSGEGVKVTIIVKDKHSWVIAPAFYTQPTNIGGGVGFGENNLFGKNQKLLLYGQIATGDSFFIGAWVIPNLGGTRWYAQVDTFLKSSRQFEYAIPLKSSQRVEDAGANQQVRESRLNYLNGGVRLGIELFRGFKVDARLRGARVTYGKTKLVEGATIDQVTDDPDLLASGSVPDPGKEGNDVSTEFTMSLDRRASYNGVATGYKVAASFENSQEGLGSDFRYFITGLGIFRGERILKEHNLQFKSHIGYGFHLPFQQEWLSGGTGQRGWLNGQFRGDFRVQANLEYSVPVFTIKGFGVRALGFLDSSFTTFLNTENPDRNYLPNSEFRSGGGTKFQQYTAPFKNSVGVGTRFYLKQIVLPLLGVDVGYGLESGDVQVYLAIGLTD